MTEDAKQTIDVLSVAVVTAAILKWLPAVAALFTLLWTYTRLHEAFTGKPFSESTLAKRITGRI